MRRLRLLFAVFALALLGPLALLVHRAVGSAVLERQIRHQALAERLFDEMERALSRLLEREEEAPFAIEIDAAERADFPFLLGRFEVAPDSAADAPEGKRDSLSFDGSERDDGGVEAPAAIRGAIAEFRRGGSEVGDRDEEGARKNKILQQPGSTLDLRARSQAAAAPAAEEKEAISTYDALRSLNKAVQERVARQRKAESSDPQEGFARRFTGQDLGMASGGRREGGAAPAPRVANEPYGRVAQDERGPLRGRIVDERNVVLYRTAVRGGRAYRQGVVLELPRLQEWLRAQALGEPTLAAHVRLQFATPFAAPSEAHGAWDFLYRHRFAEPFADLSAQLSLRALPGLGGTTYVYALSILLLATGVLGLAALYRMVSVVVAFAERRSNFVAAVTHELRTPLTAIRMYGEMLRDGMVPTEAKRDEYYRHITAESERLSRLINNVLEFSRLEKGNREVSCRRGDIAAVVREVGELLRPHAVEQGFELTLEIEPGLPASPASTISQTSGTTSSSIKRGKSCKSSWRSNYPDTK